MVTPDARSARTARSPLFRRSRRREYNKIDRPEPPSSSFKRKVGYPDSLGLAIPIKGWTFSANYFLYQEYNTPNSSASFFSMPNKVKQSGETKGISLALARSLTDSFSVGVSASYLYGRISRFEVFPIFAFLRDGDPESLVQNMRKLIQGLVISWPISREDTDLDLSAISVISMIRSPTGILKALPAILPQPESVLRSAVFCSMRTRKSSSSTWIPAASARTSSGWA